MLQTQGGLKVNAGAQVLHKNGHPIPHLYAAGDNAEGIAGGSTEASACPGYLTGTGYLQAIAFGRLAGRKAAQDAPIEPKVERGVPA